MESVNIGPALRAARLGAGPFTQADVARALGMKREATINSYECGRARPSPAQVERILDALARMQVEGKPERVVHPIGAIRRAAKLTQKQVAEELGWASPAAVVCYERGHTAMTANIERRMLDAIGRLAETRPAS